MSKFLITVVVLGRCVISVCTSLLIFWMGFSKVYANELEVPDEFKLFDKNTLAETCYISTSITAKLKHSIWMATKDDDYKSDFFNYTLASVVWSKKRGRLQSDELRSIARNYGQFEQEEYRKLNEYCGRFAVSQFKTMSEDDQEKIQKSVIRQVKEVTSKNPSFSGKTGG